MCNNSKKFYTSSLGRSLECRFKSRVDHSCLNHAWVLLLFFSMVDRSQIKKKTQSAVHFRKFSLKEISFFQTVPDMTYLYVGTIWSETERKTYKVCMVQSWTGKNQSVHWKIARRSSCNVVEHKCIDQGWSRCSHIKGSAVVQWGISCCSVRDYLLAGQGSAVPRSDISCCTVRDQLMLHCSVSGYTVRDLL